MLGSGGMEVLEVKKIQEVQSFFKAYQDFLQLLQGFKELYNSFILPEYDQNTTFFYQAEGIELRDKYKWYVNQLFQMGMGLRALSEQAASTLAILQKELDLTIQVQDPSSIKRHENNESKKTIRTRSRRN